jgi:cell surface protein SprA
LFFLTLVLTVSLGMCPAIVRAMRPMQTLPQNDTTKTEEKYEPSRFPTFEPSDRPGDPLIFDGATSPLILGNPGALQRDVEVDTALNYTFKEHIGDLKFRPPSTMTFEQYNRMHSQQMLREFWKERSAGLDGESAVSGRRLIPPIYISPVFDRIFGGSYVDIRPNGFVSLDFGGRWQRIQNPSIPIRQQKNGGFEFDQQISMNVVGKIGDKLTITADFDNNNSFDFENNLKVEYTGYEEDIIQKIEVGNVSLPLNNSLITGAQNLFGVKTQLRFGRLYFTGVASTQRGKTDEISLNTGSGGGQGREFEVRGSEYEENRHYFLGHFFRDNFEQWLRATPQIISGVNITRIEVYVINRQNNTETLRNFAAFMDLGEGRVLYQQDNPRVAPGLGGASRNDANRLFSELNGNPAIRDVDQVTNILESDFNFSKATDYEIITAARKLAENEYIVNSRLGFITLIRKLQNDEALAVAYEYTHNGQSYKVGELTEDYQNRPESEVIFLKMLRPTKIDVSVPTWDLMMKNIYSLNASQVAREGFQLRVIYRDDRTGIDNPSLHEGARIRDVPLVQLLGLDRLNPSNDPQPDGNFDFVEGITILPQTGQIIFPTLEPFGAKLRSYFNPVSEANLINKYVYDTLYSTTKADAELEVTKNKFFLSGMMQAGSAAEVVLPGINIAENSVTVLAGNTPLTEGTDYRVDYNLGRVTIINEAVLNSGKPVKIKYEKADLFNFQSRSLLGGRFDYRWSENINIGGTLLYLNERPLISRISIGNEPTRNLKYGMDINYQKESRLLTRIVDALPLIQTKAPSSISFNAEFAQIRPGTSNIVNGEGTSYIDDFEATATPFNLGNNILNWKLAHTPVTEDDRFTLGAENTGGLELGYKRAKLAWYIVDNIFYRTAGSAKPTNITQTDLQNHYVRPIVPQEIFRFRNQEVINTNEPIFDMAFFPRERGPYNYNSDLDNAGFLNDPRSNWGGITRAITSDVDFDKNNIEYIEFWMMDPFVPGENGRVLDGIDNSNNTTGGQLIFNLGSISEDVIKDNRHGFENGLPADGDTSKVLKTTWGYVTRQQFLTNAFDNSTAARLNQDIGLDGLRNEEESEYHAEFVDDIRGNVNQDALDRILADVSADDFQYYLGSELDAADAKILERYKDFNGTEGNSPVSTGGNTQFTPSGSNLPDNEDLNRDNTISDLEEYYEYKIDLRPGDLEIGQNFITDKVVNNVNGDEITWYQFRIPVRQPTGRFGNITGFKSIRFLRMYVTDWSESVVLRFANYRLIGSQWRKFNESLYDPGYYEIPEPYDARFDVSVVNIEDNGAVSGDKIPYVLPPGIQRDVDNTSPIVRFQNEQSMKLCVTDLKDRDARAVFKNIATDLINYGRLKMFFHAQENGGELNDDDVTAFLRLGTDFKENYYEIEVPLKITRLGATSPEEIWPAENEIDIRFDELYALKSQRNRLGINVQLPYSDTVGVYKITVKGRPDMQSVQTAMIGIRNPESPDQAPKSVCIWANEMRVTDFERSPGWAANAYLSARMADFATVNASTRYTSFGFGGIQQRIAERTRVESFEYDVSANVKLDKFIPEKAGIQLPMYVSYEDRKITPRFDPLDPDIPLDAALQSIEDPQERAEYKKIVQDRVVRRSINFTNVRKVKTGEDPRSHIYDIENLSLTYAYSDAKATNVNTESNVLKSHRASVGYNFSPQGGLVEPFKNAKAFSGKYLQLLRDMNFQYIPSNMSFRFDLDRRFNRTQLRNSDLTTTGIRPMYEKYFGFNRMYNMRWNISRGLSFDYSARASAIVDEPDGDLDTSSKRELVWENLKKLGRMKSFNQNFNLNYRIPLDKLPLTDWLSADASYSVGYSWSAGAWSPIDSLNIQRVLGNTAQNNRDVGLRGKVDMLKLYNKAKFLREVNNPRRSPRRPSPQDTTRQKGEQKFLKGLTRLLMSVRSINANITVREGTMLTGFRPVPFLLGMDSTWGAPGWAFLFGSQNPDIRNVAAAKGWLVQDTLLSIPFTQMRTLDMSFSANIEPSRALRIQLDARRSGTGNYQELFRVTPDVNDVGIYQGVNPARSGSYSITTWSFLTAFTREGSDNQSPTFDKFVENLDIMKNRLDRLNPDPEISYARRSQDVMIPAFLAAYTGKDARTHPTTPFPNFPLPGWRIDFSGLNKIPAIAEVFSNLSINHSYSSTYSITNYTNSLLYQEGLELRERLSFYPAPTEGNENNEWIPVFMMNSVVISERFAPLVGINIRTKGRVTARIDYKKERNLALNMSNAQVTELKSNDIVFDVGFTKANMKLPFKTQGRVITLENDLTFKLNFTLRDTKTIQRKIDEESTVTAGNINFQIRPQISYVMSQRLNLNFYFERNVNTPRVTSAFPRSTTAFGVQVRFSLAQ